MKIFLFILLKLALFANHLHGSDEFSALDYRWIKFVSLTPTNIVLKSGRGGIIVFGPDMKEYQLEHHKQFKIKYHDDWMLQENVEFTIPLDKEVRFSDRRHIQVNYNPVEYENKQRGFQIIDRQFWFGMDNANVIRYVVLNDKPEEAREEDVVRI